MMNTARPSSTIQAATITGLSMSLLWLLIPEITDYVVPAPIVSVATALAMAVVGYFTKEKIINQRLG